jgi:hypothetical protein
MKSRELPLFPLLLYWRLCMIHSEHPTMDEIRAYVKDTLPDEKHCDIGNHIYSCHQCMEKTRAAYKDTLIIENWSPQSIGELIWRMNIIAEMKNRTIFQRPANNPVTQEKLAAESPQEEKYPVIRHYYSKDKKVIATVEYAPGETEVSFEMKESPGTKKQEIAIIVFAFARMNTREILVCDKVTLKMSSPGLWETRWKGNIEYTPDITLLFTW